MTTNAWPRGDRASLTAFYGDPDGNRDGVVDPAWFSANILRIGAPYPMVWAWNGEPVKGIACHRRVAPSLQRILTAIPTVCTAEEIARHELHKCGGVFAFRAKRGAASLSTHAYAAALDLSPELNPFGRRWRDDGRMMPRKVVALFEDEGWEWGGLWKTGDAMHFQAVRL